MLGTGLACWQQLAGFSWLGGWQLAGLWLACWLAGWAWRREYGTKCVLAECTRLFWLLACWWLAGCLQAGWLGGWQVAGLAAWQLADGWLPAA